MSTETLTEEDRILLEGPQWPLIHSHLDTACRRLYARGITRNAP